jgi:hypothetical protein
MKARLMTTHEIQERVTTDRTAAADLILQAKQLVNAARIWDGDSYRDRRNACLDEAWALIDRVQHDPDLVPLPVATYPGPNA